MANGLPEGFVLDPPEEPAVQAQPVNEIQDADVIATVSTGQLPEGFVVDPEGPEPIKSYVGLVALSRPGATQIELSARKFARGTLAWLSRPQGYETKSLLEGELPRPLELAGRMKDSMIEGFYPDWFLEKIGRRTEIKAPQAEGIAEKVADFTGGATGFGASLVGLGGIFDKIAGGAKYIPWIKKLAVQAPRAFKLAGAGLKTFATLATRGQIELPPEAEVESRVKQLGSDAITSSLFFGAGQLGNLPKGGGIIRSTAMFGIGYGTAKAQGLDETDALIHGTGLVLLDSVHGSSASKNKAQRVAIKTLQQKGYTKAQATQIVNALEQAGITKSQFKQAYERSVQEAKTLAAERAQYPERFAKPVAAEVSGQPTAQPATQAAQTLPAPSQARPTVTGAVVGAGVARGAPVTPTALGALPVQPPTEAAPVEAAPEVAPEAAPEVVEEPAPVPEIVREIEAEQQEVAREMITTLVSPEEVATIASDVESDIAVAEGVSPTRQLGDMSLTELRAEADVLGIEVSGRETKKAILNKLTGVTREQPTEEFTQRQFLKQQSIAAKKGFNAGRKEAREQMNAVLRQQAATMEQRRAAVVEYASQRLSVKDQQAIRSIAFKAKGPRSLAKALAQIDGMEERYRANTHKQLLQSYDKLAGKSLMSDAVAAEDKAGIRESLNRFNAEKDRMSPERAQAELDALKEQVNSAKIRRDVKAAIDDVAQRVILRDINESASSPVSRVDLAEAGFGVTPGIGTRLGIFVRNIANRSINVARENGLSVTPIDAMMDRLDGNQDYNGTLMRHFKMPIDARFGTYLSESAEKKKALTDIVNQYNLNEESRVKIGIHGQLRQYDNRDDGLEDIILRGSQENVPEEDIRRLAAEPLTEGEQDWMDKFDEINAEALPRIRDLAQSAYNREVAEIPDYFPRHVDSRMQGNKIADILVDDAIHASARRRNPAQGFILTRDPNASSKIILDAGKVASRHIDDVTYFLSMGDKIRQLARVASSDDFQNKYGDMGQEFTLDWLDLLARKGGSEDAHKAAWMNKLLKNTTAAQLAGRLSTVMIQPTAYFDAAAMIGPQWVQKGIIDTANDFGKWQGFVVQNLPELAFRSGLDDPALQMFTDDTPLDKAVRIGLKPIQMVDQFVALTSTVGAYQQALADKGIIVDAGDPIPVDENALARAQLMLRRTQASSFFKDRPLVVTKGKGFTGQAAFNKAIFQYQNFLLNRWSVIRHDAIRSGVKGDEKDKIKSSKIMLWLTVATLAETLGREGVNKLQDLLTGKQEDSKKTITEKFVLNALDAVPIAGRLARTTSSGYKTTGVPIFDALLLKPSVALGQIGREQYGRGALGLAEFATSAVGVPGSGQAIQIARDALREDTGNGEVPESMFRAGDEGTGLFNGGNGGGGLF